MPKGLWVWPADAMGQRGLLRRVAASPHLMAAMSAMAKSKEGMADSELAEALNDGSEWTTLWVIRQLTSLGFVEYKVDFFGNPARYQRTELEEKIRSLEAAKASLLSDVASLKEKIATFELEKSANALESEVQALRTEKAVLEEKAASYEAEAGYALPPVVAEGV